MDVISLVDMPIYERFPSKIFMKDKNVIFRFSGRVFKEI